VFLPLIHRGDKLNALVVGGGKIAKRKVEDLLDAAARVSIISPEIHPDLEKIIAENGITFFRREVLSGDVLSSEDEPYNLVIVSTDDNKINVMVSEECRSAGIPVNVVDIPELCTVYFAAIVKRNPILVAISTGGAAPFLARELKKSAGEWLDSGWADRAKWAELIRAFAMKNIDTFEERNIIYDRFMTISDVELSNWDLKDPPETLWRSWVNPEREN
jgi:uroporphyrin-III C-methyltransferase / precorrin-2 dehydrogenase / sirohydrochlorin ferrochelatase